MYKLYDLPFSMTGEAGSARVPARRVAFSSYPAVLASLDDFYMTSAGLVIQEGTTHPHASPPYVAAHTHAVDRTRGRPHTW